jgi:hypothetical protein
VGLAFGYFGYSLFLAVPQEREGQINIRYNQLSIKLVRVSAGVCYGLFGVIIICFTIFKGIDFGQTPDISTAKNILPQDNPLEKIPQKVYKK